MNNKDFDTADLHIHSEASDGVDSYETLIAKAKKARIGTISITDHNFINFNQFEKYTKRNPEIEMIMGVEALVTDARNIQNLEVLGYNFEPDIKKIRDSEFVAKMRERNKEAKKYFRRFVKNLEKQGVEITPRRYGIKSLSELALAIASKGSKTTREIIDELKVSIGSGNSFPIGNIEDVMKLMHEAEFIPVLAHPGEIKLEGQYLAFAIVHNHTPIIDSFDKYLLEKKEQGLKGLECICAYEKKKGRDFRTVMEEPRNKAKVMRHFTTFSDENEFVKTGGDDYHEDSRSPFGQEVISYSAVEKLRQTWNALFK